MEYLSRLTVDDVDTLVLVADATAIGLRSAKRIAELADSLPVRVNRRILALNKIGQIGPNEIASPNGWSEAVDAIVEVPFDDDLLRRCVRGEAIDGAAGDVARSSTERLARLCVSTEPGISRHPGTKNTKETIT